VILSPACPSEDREARLLGMINDTTIEMQRDRCRVLLTGEERGLGMKGVEMEYCN
jgi:hypothetical protein